MPFTFPKMMIKRALSVLDIELKRRSRSPEVTLLGLKNLPIRTVLDVGANLGQFARMISSIFPKARIYCFEPLPKVFAQLQKQGDQQITAIQVALGEVEGEIEMHEHVEHAASSSFLVATELTHRYYPVTCREVSTHVKMMRLDRAIDTFSISLRDDLLIKLDVQGFEDRVIRGGSKTFGKARACILEINLQNLYADQARFPLLVSMLDEAGLHYSGNLNQSDAPDGGVIAIDAIFLRN